MGGGGKEGGREGGLKERKEVGTKYKESVCLEICYVRAQHFCLFCFVIHSFTPPSLPPSLPIYRQGKSAPSSALIATRSLQAGFRKTYLANLDKDYYLCVHEADQEMLGSFDTLVSEGEEGGREGGRDGGQEREAMTHTLRGSRRRESPDPDITHSYTNKHSSSSPVSNTLSSPSLPPSYLLPPPGRLPAKYWDPVTRWKFDSLLDVFRRNMVVDAEILDLVRRKTGGREGGREREEL